MNLPMTGKTGSFLEAIFRKRVLGFGVRKLRKLFLLPGGSWQPVGEVIYSLFYSFFYLSKL